MLFSSINPVNQIQPQVQLQLQPQLQTQVQIQFFDLPLVNPNLKLSLSLRLSLRLSHPSWYSGDCRIALNKAARRTRTVSSVPPPL